jgi:predicted nucleic acid-binding Zn ribbon protein
MSTDPPASTGKSPDSPPSRSAGEPGWDPDGTELAKALMARAKAAGRMGGGPQPSGRRRTSRSSRRRASGAGWSGPAGDDRDPQTLRASLDRLVGEHGWEEDLSVHGVVARWDQIVGADVAAHVRPERYAGGVITVRADSSAWATQVRLLAPQLVRRLNEEIGDGTVTRVDVLAPQAPTWRKGLRSIPGRGPRDTYG